MSNEVGIVAAQHQMDYQCQAFFVGTSYHLASERSHPYTSSCWTPSTYPCDGMCGLLERNVLTDAFARVRMPSMTFERPALDDCRWRMNAVDKRRQCTNAIDSIRMSFECL